MFEIERKFELSTENFIKHCVPCIKDSYQLTQRYLDSGNIRIRKLETKDNTSYFIIEKYKRFERETASRIYVYEITREVYSILESLTAERVFKTRFKLDSSDFEWHLGLSKKVYIDKTFSVYVDIFSNGKTILELELLSNIEVGFPTIKIPNWFGKEILESNYTMACKGIV